MQGNSSRCPTQLKAAAAPNAPSYRAASVPSLGHRAGHGLRSRDTTARGPSHLGHPPCASRPASLPLRIPPSPLRIPPSPLRIPPSPLRIPPAPHPSRPAFLLLRYASLSAPHLSGSAPRSVRLLPAARRGRGRSARAGGGADAPRSAAPPTVRPLRLCGPSAVCGPSACAAPPPVRPLRLCGPSDCAAPPQCAAAPLRRRERPGPRPSSAQRGSALTSQ